MSGGDTQQQILDAVQAVIVRDGVRGTSMRQVAQEADVSLGLLSYHFDDKQSLILAAFQRATSRLFAASTNAIHGIEDPSERVRLFLRGGYTSEFLNGDYLRLRISLWAVALTDETIAAVDLRFFEEYAEAFQALIAEALPAISASAARQQALDAVALANGLWLNWARYQNSEELELGLLRCEDIALADTA